MRRKGAADVDSLRIVDVVASFQLDSLVMVSPTNNPQSTSPAAAISTLSEVTCWPATSRQLPAYLSMRLFSKAWHV